MPNQLVDYNGSLLSVLGSLTDDINCCCDVGPCVQLDCLIYQSGFDNTAGTRDYTWFVQRDPTDPPVTSIKLNGVDQAYNPADTTHTGTITVPCLGMADEYRLVVTSPCGSCESVVEPGCMQRSSDKFVTISGVPSSISYGPCTYNVGDGYTHEYTITGLDVLNGTRVFPLLNTCTYNDVITLPNPIVVFERWTSNVSTNIETHTLSGGDLVIHQNNNPFDQSFGVSIINAPTEHRHQNFGGTVNTVRTFNLYAFDSTVSQGDCVETLEAKTVFNGVTSGVSPFFFSSYPMPGVFSTNNCAVCPPANDPYSCPTPIPNIEVTQGYVV
jgi:hypothetical protein